MRKTYKYPLSPTKEVTQKLSWTLTRCREVYNAALSERKDAYKRYERTVLYQNEQGQCIAVRMEANLKVNDVSYLQQKRDLGEAGRTRGTSPDRALRRARLQISPALAGILSQ